MSQVTSSEVPSGSGLSVRQAINAVLAALMSNNSGSSEPPNPIAGMAWFDTTANDIKIRNASNTDWLLLSDMIGAVEYDRVQSLTTAEQDQALANIRASDFPIGYAYQKITSGRSFGVTYTNTTGRPMFVSVIADVNAATRSLDMLVNGQSVSKQEFQAQSTFMILSVSGFVPAGATYKVDGDGFASSTPRDWVEFKKA